jgi:uncharacterized oxidoreductase
VRLAGHAVLVTGGSTGIGFALASALAARGNRVAICGRRPEALASAVAAVPALVPLRCDLADPGQVRQLPEQVREQLGGLSLLVNNAGIQLNYDFSREPASEILSKVDAELAVNLAGLAKVTALLLPDLRRAGHAAIVNVSSGLGLVPKKSAPIYCATKAAVHLFSKSLRWQLEDAGWNVRVFEVLPPLADTAMTEGRGSGKLRPEEVAEAALRGMTADRWEIAVGKVRLLRLLSRLAPGLAERILRDA